MRQYFNSPAGCFDFAQHDNFTQGMRKMDIFRRKMGILIALRRFFLIMFDELWRVRSGV